MTQNEKQTVVCIVGAEVMVTQMAQNQFLFEGGDECKQHFLTAAQEMKIAVEMLFRQMDADQKKEIQKVLNTYKMSMLPINDPLVKNKKYMVDDADMKVILKHLYEDCCHLCTKDNTQVRYCELRRALLNAGEEGTQGGLNYARCEYS